MTTCPMFHGAEITLLMAMELARKESRCINIAGRVRPTKSRDRYIGTSKWSELLNSYGTPSWSD